MNRILVFTIPIFLFVVFPLSFPSTVYIFYPQQIRNTILIGLRAFELVFIRLDGVFLIKKIESQENLFSWLSLHSASSSWALWCQRKIDKQHDNWPVLNLYLIRNEIDHSGYWVRPNLWLFLGRWSRLWGSGDCGMGYILPGLLIDG